MKLVSMEHVENFMVYSTTRDCNFLLVRQFLPQTHYKFSHSLYTFIDKKILFKNKVISRHKFFNFCTHCLNRNFLFTWMDYNSYFSFYSILQKRNLFFLSINFQLLIEPDIIINFQSYPDWNHRCWYSICINIFFEFFL